MTSPRTRPRSPFTDAGKRLARQGLGVAVTIDQILDIEDEALQDLRADIAAMVAEPPSEDGMLYNAAIREVLRLVDARTAVPSEAVTRPDLTCPKCGLNSHDNEGEGWTHACDQRFLGALASLPDRYTVVPSEAVTPPPNVVIEAPQGSVLVTWTDPWSMTIGEAADAAAALLGRRGPHTLGNKRSGVLFRRAEAVTLLGRVLRVVDAASMVWRDPVPSDAIDAIHDAKQYLVASGWYAAMQDPAFVASLSEGLADVAAGRTVPFLPSDAETGLSDYDRGFDDGYRIGRREKDQPAECPRGCGCRLFLDQDGNGDADERDCGCDGPCTKEGLPIWLREPESGLLLVKVPIAAAVPSEADPPLAAIVRDVVYGLRHQPAISREDIAVVIEREVLPVLGGEAVTPLDPERLARAMKACGYALMFGDQITDRDAAKLAREYAALPTDRPTEHYDLALGTRADQEAGK